MKRFLTLQLIAWVLLFVLYYFYLKIRWPGIQESLALSHAVIAFIFFAVMIYGYSLFIFPRYFRSALTTSFILISASFFVAVYTLRIVTESELIPRITSGNRGIFYYGKIQILYNLVSSIIAFSIAVLFTHVIASLNAQKRDQEIAHRQTESELNLLKSQVQPHFLFNSLNNIYYDTYKSLPVVAERIAMLAGIMRYFLEESNKQTVPLSTEVQMLRNYIDLEKERFTDIRIHAQLDIKEDIQVPPMLLMPLVENLFKHANFADAIYKQAFITLNVENDMVRFCVKNPFNNSNSGDRTGTGLKNLQKRLELYYGDKFELSISTKDRFFCAMLTFPISMQMQSAAEVKEKPKTEKGERKGPKRSKKKADTIVNCIASAI